MIKEPRRVGFKTILTLLTQKRIHLSIGVILTLLPVGVGSIFLLVSTLTDSGIPKVDYDQITDHGESAMASITNIETQSNITVNNEHPSIISYEYLTDDNVETHGVYRSMNPAMINKMNIGDSVQIMYLADNSVIVGLEPFEFPLNIVLGILTPLLIIGIITLVTLYLRIKNILNLFKYGSVKEAELVSMTIKNGLPISGIGQGVIVQYQYNIKTGVDILGQSFTNDHSILSSKKQGDFIKVFVSDLKESNSCLIPKAESIRNNWNLD